MPKLKVFFSIVNDVKCKKGNRLGEKAFNAVSVIWYNLEAINKSCSTYLIVDFESLYEIKIFHMT